MPADDSRTSLQLRSLVRGNGELELSLASTPIPEPAPDEVLVRIEAAPINPSDLGLLFGAADMSTARYSGTGASPVVTASIPEKLMKAMAGRVDQSMPVGNEGAGVVVKAGDPLVEIAADDYSTLVQARQERQLLSTRFNSGESSGA